MNVTMQIPDYDGNAIDVIWEQNSSLSIEADDQIVVISGNKQGLISLAKQMIYIALNDLPVGSHVHFDRCCNMGIAGNFDLVIDSTGE